LTTVVGAGLGKRRIHRSTDSGASWTAVGPSLTGGSAATGVATEFAERDNSLYISAISGGSAATLQWYRSTDDGVTWTNPSNPGTRATGRFTYTLPPHTATPTHSTFRHLTGINVEWWTSDIVDPTTLTADWSTLRDFANMGSVGITGDPNFSLLDGWLILARTNRILGIELSSLCPTPPKLHIPHPNWYRYPPPRAHRFQIENWRALQVWADKLMRLGGTSKKLHVHIPVGQPVDEQGHARAAKQVTDANYRNYRRLEQWADSLCHTHPLHIPHKRLPEARLLPKYSLTVEQQNWQAIQRWADQLRA
jgi:hypothetical protein